MSFFVACSLSVAFWLFPDNGRRLIAHFTSADPMKLFTGTWKGVTHYASESGDIVESGYTRLLGTGQYDYSGDVEIHMAGGAIVQYTALATGTWKPTDNGFVITALDIKTAPRVLKQPGRVEVDLANPPFLNHHWSFPRLETLMPHGTSQECKTTEITLTHLRASGTDIKGKSVTYEATRQ